MSRLKNSVLPVATIMLAHSGMALAQEDGAAAAGAAAAAAAGAVAVSEIPIAEDLAAVIALQGQACAKVVSAVATGEDAYAATCQDGNRYRVFINPEGRVVVAKVE